AIAFTVAYRAKRGANHHCAADQRKEVAAVDEEDCWVAQQRSRSEAGANATSRRKPQHGREQRGESTDEENDKQRDRIDPVHQRSRNEPKQRRQRRHVEVIYVRPLEPPHVEPVMRSEEHTSELQSRSDLVCRLLLEKKK